MVKNFIGIFLTLAILALVLFAVDKRNERIKCIVTKGVEACE